MPKVQSCQPLAENCAPGRGCPTLDFREWLEQRRLEFDQALDQHLKTIESATPPHSRLYAAVQYSLRLGGKRLRPVLVLECSRVCGGQSEAALPAALAIEFMHTFSLIHDDLPAMDDDEFRRGQPTNHRVFGEGLAVLAGDWLAAGAFRLLASAPCAPATTRALVESLAAGTLAMIEGQAADLAGEKSAPDGELVRYIHERKTAALIEACCRLGATCAGAAEESVAALACYGRHLGLAFQIVDDLLDVTGTTEQLGKRVGKDVESHKQTYPAAFGVEESRAAAGREVAAAVAALERFGPAGERLRELARYVAERDR